MIKKMFSAPFLAFILCGTIVPLGVIAYYGLTDRSGAFTWANVMAMASGDHAKALLLSLALSLASTVICLILAFPLGLILKDSKLGKKGFMVFIFILPMWMNFLLRTMAWQVLLEKSGVINGLLAAVGLPALEIINTPAAVVLGMVYDYLPFMVLPIYNALIKIDRSIIEAAYDLGASSGTVLRKVIIPMTIPGIVSGVTMVFVPSLTTFAISNMLGGGKVNLIGNIIEQEFTTSSNWNLGSGLSLVMMIFIVISMAMIEKFDKNGEGSVL
ncbi:MAG: ABC transporter permease [Firmicutes bacterium]|nr:ABC transporter permease [Bacillota bacterium]MBQ1959180.1 ABC transporter permease [Bacillota bacterium]